MSTGLGDMAVSNTIGSNVFDILVGLGVPWSIQTMAVNYGSVVSVTLATCRIQSHPHTFKEEIWMKHSVIVNVKTREGEFSFSLLVLGENQQ